MSDTALRFLGQGTIVLRGPVTSRVYYFVAGGDATVVDARDLDAFVRTRLFAAGAS